MMYIVESWQTYANTTDLLRKWVSTTGNGAQLTQGGCLMNGSVVSYINAHFPPLTTLMMGFEITLNAYATTLANSSMIHTLMGGETNGSNQIGIGVNTTGTLSVFYGSNFSGLGGTTLANGTTVLALGAKNWIEFKVVYHATAGSVEVRINGVQEILLTGINTIASGLSGWAERIALVAGASSLHLFGGVYLGDGAEGWQGPSTVKRLALTADTAQKNFAPSSGTVNYTLVNDLNTYTSFVSTGNIGDEDLYAFAKIPYTPGTVRAVKVEAQAQNTVSTNLIKSLVPVMAMGGSTRGGGPKLLGAALPSTWYNAPYGVFTLAPDGAAWTPNKLQSCAVGMRVAAWRAGINFRSTAAFVTDAAQNTYCIGDVYPTTRGGLTFGWNTAGTGTVKVDRLAASGDFYAGINCQQNNGTQRTFKLDLPAAGRYAIKAIFGDEGFAQGIYYAQFMDGATVLKTIDSRTMGSGAFTAAANRVINASGRCQFAVGSYAEFGDWIEVTLTGTQLGVLIGTPALAGVPDYTCITHLEVIALDYAPAPSALAPTVQVASLFVEALISNDTPIMQCLS